MTINHVFLKVSNANLTALRTFYASALEPLGYREMFQKGDGLIAFGSNFPYFWIQALPEGTVPTPTHLAFDAPSELLFILKGTDIDQPRQ